MLSRANRRKPARARYLPPPQTLEPEVDVPDPALETSAADASGDVPPPPPRSARGSNASLLRFGGGASVSGVSGGSVVSLPLVASAVRSGGEPKSELSEKSEKSLMGVLKTKSRESHGSHGSPAYAYNGHQPYQTSAYEDPYAFGANVGSGIGPGITDEIEHIQPYGQPELNDTNADEDIGWADYAEDFDDQISIPQHNTENVRPNQNESQEPFHEPYHDQDHYEEQSQAQAYRYPPENEYTHSNPAAEDVHHEHHQDAYQQEYEDHGYNDNEQLEHENHFQQEAVPHDDVEQKDSQDYSSGAYTGHDQHGKVTESSPIHELEKMHLYSVVSSPFEGKNTHHDDSICPKDVDPIASQEAIAFHEEHEQDNGGVIEQSEQEADRHTVGVEQAPSHSTQASQSQHFDDHNWDQQHTNDESPDFFSNLTKDTVVYNPIVQDTNEFRQNNDTQSEIPHHEHVNDLYTGSHQEHDDFFSQIGNNQYSNEHEAQPESHEFEHHYDEQEDTNNLQDYNLEQIEEQYSQKEEGGHYDDHQSQHYYYNHHDDEALADPHNEYTPIERPLGSPSSQVIEDSPHPEDHLEPEYNYNEQYGNQVESHGENEATEQQNQEEGATNLDDLFADDNDFILDQSPKKSGPDTPVEPSLATQYDISTRLEMLDLDDDLLLDDEPEFLPEDTPNTATSETSKMAPELQHMNETKPPEFVRHGSTNRYVPQPGIPGQRSSFSVASQGPIFSKHPTPTPKPTIIQPHPQIRGSGLSSPAVTSNDEFVRKLEEEKKKHDAYDFPEGMIPAISKPPKLSTHRYAPHTPQPQVRSPSPNLITGPVRPHGVLIDTSTEEIREQPKVENPAKSFFEELPLPDVTKKVKPARSAAPVKVANPVSPSIVQPPSFAATEQVKAPVNPYAVNATNVAKPIKNNYAPPARYTSMAPPGQSKPSVPVPPPMASKYAPPAPTASTGPPSFPVPNIQQQQQVPAILQPGQNLNTPPQFQQNAGFNNNQFQQNSYGPPQPTNQFIPPPAHQFQPVPPANQFQQSHPSAQGGFQANPAYSNQPHNIPNQQHQPSIGSPVSQLSQNSALSQGSHVQTTPKQSHSQPFPTMQGPTKPSLNTNVPKSMSQGSPYMPSSGRYAPSSHRRNHSRASSIIGGSTKDGNNPYAPALPSVQDASLPATPATLAPIPANRQRGASGSRSHLRNVSGKPTTQDPNALLRRQFPIFNWSGSTKVVCLIPEARQNFNGPPAVKLQVKSIRDIVDVSKYDTFPGPLMKGKTKKKDVEKWLESQIERVKLDQNKQEELILCNILLCLLKFDLSDFEQVKDFAKTVCSVINPNVNYNNNDPIEYNGSLNVANAYKLDNAGINTVFTLLQSGRPEKALEYAISKGDWSMGLVIAYLSGSDEFARIAADYARVAFPFQRANNKVQHLMPYLLKIFAGNVSSAINDLTSVPNEGEWSCHYWRDFVSAVLISCSKSSTEFFREFGKFLGSNGKVVAAEICFILGGTPLLPVPPVGGNGNGNDIVFPYISASTIYTEIYEYILATAPNSTVPPNGMPHLADVKVKHASYLVDMGLVNEGQKYIDYLGNVFKANAGNKNAVISERTKIALQKLVVRLTASGSGEQGWFGLKVSKVNLDKVWGQLDKFIGGSDPVPKPPTDSGVFSKFSPSISRSTSVLDFTSNAQQQMQQRPPMDHTLSSNTLPPSMDAVSRHMTPIQRNTTFLSQGMSPHLHQGPHTPNVPVHPQHSQAHQSSPHSKYTPSNMSASHLPTTIDESEEPSAHMAINSRYAPGSRKSVGGLSNASISSHHPMPPQKHQQYPTHTKKISISSSISDAGVLEFSKPPQKAPPSARSVTSLHPSMESPKMQMNETFQSSPKFNVNESEKSEEMPEPPKPHQSAPPQSSEGRFEYGAPSVPHVAGPGSNSGTLVASSHAERRTSHREGNTRYAPPQKKVAPIMKPPMEAEIVAEDDEQEDVDDIVASLPIQAQHAQLHENVPETSSEQPVFHSNITPEIPNVEKLEEKKSRANSVLLHHEPQEQAAVEAEEEKEATAPPPVDKTKPPQRKTSNVPPRANPYAPSQAAKRATSGRNKYGPPSGSANKYAVNTNTNTPVKNDSVDTPAQDLISMFDYGGYSGGSVKNTPTQPEQHPVELEPEQTQEEQVESEHIEPAIEKKLPPPTDTTPQNYGLPQKKVDQLRSPPASMGMGIVSNDQMMNANPLAPSSASFEPPSPMIRMKKPPTLNQSGRDHGGYSSFDVSKNEVLDTSFGEFPIPGSPELTTRANSEIGGPGLFSSRLSQSQQSELYQQYEVQDDTVGDYVPILEEDEDDDEPTVKRPASSKKLSTPPQPAKKMKTESKDKAKEREKDDDEKSTTSKGTIEGKWFGSWFGSKEETEERPKAIRAKLGNKSQFYYSEEHKRWIDGSRSIEEQLKKDAPPPPPKAKATSGPSTTPKTPIPAAKPPAPVSGGQAVDGANTANPKPNPKPKPSGPSLASADLDTLLTMGGNNPLAGARRPKKANRRYVSVMEK